MAVGQDALVLGGLALTEAFSRFRETAASLEASYSRLQAEVVHLREELDETNRDLEREREQSRRRQALAEVSAMLAHEIRNPLGSLELFAQWLADSALADEQRAWLGHMQAGIRTLGATVNNVLHWHSPCELRLVPTDLGAWLDEMAGFLAPLAQQAGVQLVVSNHLHRVMVPADRNGLQQVALNLGLNGFRAMPGGGVLRLTGHVLRLKRHDADEDAGADAAAQQVCIEFEDTGAGIAPEIQEQIFQAGFSTLQGGPGLGLAVCQTIVRQHQGQLRACNSAGGGACFRLQLGVDKPLCAGTRRP